MKSSYLPTIILLALLWLTVHNRACAQREKSFYVELLGASTTAGIHYDSRFNQNTRWGGRIGVAFTYSRSQHFFSFGPDRTKGISFPLAVNYLVFGGKHHLELGIGMSYGLYQCTDTNKGGYTMEHDENGLFGFFDIGYRYQPSQGITVRAGINPGTALWQHDDMGRKLNGVDRAAVIYPYVSVGYSF